MNIYRFACTLLQPGYEVPLDEKPTTEDTAETVAGLILEMKDNPHAPFDPEDSKLWVYDPESETKPCRFEDWNIDDNGKVIDKVMDRQVLVYGAPEMVHEGVNAPGDYIDYIGDFMAEDIDVEMENVGQDLYNEAVKMVEKAIGDNPKKYVPGSADDLLRIKYAGPFPYFTVGILTYWSMHSSQDYWGEWDTSIEMVGFVDLTGTKRPITVAKA